MSTPATPPITRINSNTVDLDQFKGAVKRCPLCNVESTMRGRACTLCFDRKFVAECLRCKGTGLQSQGTVWDGGQSEHRSTCSACGGSGYFPAPKPKDWKDEVLAADETAAK